MTKEDLIEILTIRLESNNKDRDNYKSEYCRGYIDGSNSIIRHVIELLNDDLKEKK